MKKRQLTGPETATSRSIAESSAAELKIEKNWCLSLVGVGILNEALDRTCPH